MNKQSIQLITAPAREPLTLGDAKRFLHANDDDDLIVLRLINAARMHIEDMTSRALITQQWRMTLDYFEHCIEIRKPPLQTVDAVKYIDTDNVLQTLDSAEYSVDSDSEPARLSPAYGKTWPETLLVNGAVNIEFTAGYGAGADSIPESIQSALLLNIEKHYDREERMGSYLDEAMTSLLNPYVIVDM